ncbi:MAG: hypothetical protein GC180_01385 [Bacteroidetes bacterium]|nr:hypothetical protein [Bacteroidota bacterium]
MTHFRNVFFTLIFLWMIPFAQGQIMFPQWNAGDTQSYFITRSELVDNERLSLEIFEIDLHILKKNEKRSIIEAHLRLKPLEGQGEHWKSFYKRLETIPFVYYFEENSSGTFSHPVQTDATKGKLRQTMRDLLALDHIQPLPYKEITDWFGSTEIESIPDTLLSYFRVLNPLFDKYGQPSEGLGRIAFTNPVTHCNDSTVNCQWILNTSSSGNGTNEITMKRMFYSDSTNDIGIFQSLAKCSKLEGLETSDIMPDAYSNSLEEVWKAKMPQSDIFYYTYRKIIEMRFGKAESKRSWETRIVRSE